MTNRRTNIWFLQILKNFFAGVYFLYWLQIHSLMTKVYYLNISRSLCGKSQQKILWQVFDSFDEYRAMQQQSARLVWQLDCWESFQLISNCRPSLPRGCRLLVTVCCATTYSRYSNSTTRLQYTLLHSSFISFKLVNSKIFIHDPVSRASVFLAQRKFINSI